MSPIRPPLGITSAAVLIIASLAGCASVGPDYQRAEVNAPVRWSEPTDAVGVRAAEPVAAWWRGFDDDQLSSLIDRAVRANPDLRIAQARVREARARYGIASADGGPSADASSSVARDQESHHQPVLGSIPLPKGVPFTNDVYQAGFDASWEIDVFGGLRREQEQAAAEVEAADDARRASLVSLLGEVARTYLDLRAAQRRIEIAGADITTQEQSLAISKESVQHGLTSDLDIEQASTLLATTRAGIPPLEGLERIAIHRLGILIGQPPGTLLTELTAHKPIPAAPPEVPIGLPSTLLLRRPDVQRAERQLAAATAAIGVARADLYPRFFLTGGAGFESVSASDWFSKGSSIWSIGPSISWRIFDSGRVRANIRVQDARLEQAEAAYAQAILAAFEDVENALVSYAKEQVRQRHLADAVSTSRASLAVADQLYVNGLKDNLTVLDAERSLHDSQDQLILSQQAVAEDLVALYKALGGGWEGIGEDADGVLSQVDERNGRRAP
jgi:NodT family efflux transporter outer membrane factor (OMF) lipoprotein